MKNIPSLPHLRRWAVGALLCAAACSPSQLVDNAPLPPEVPDPGATHTPAGAVTAHNGALSQFALAFGGYSGSVVLAAALLGDELQPRTYGQPIGVWDDAIAVDSRVLVEYQTPNDEQNAAIGRYTYGGLQSVRGQTHEARGLLLRYAPDSVRHIAQVYALEAYADVYLAELFCSGIPLSTLDYDGDFTLAPGSPTEEVLHRAVALFDSALAFGGGHPRVRDLARVGRARALLALGDFPGAAQTVAEVADDYEYAVTYGGGNQNGRTNFARVPSQWAYNVSDRAGANGLDYRSSGDPRTAVRTLPDGIYHPLKYGTDGASPIVVASGVEARLIEAEAALRSGDTATWLAKLNHLRATAITPALADTTDPGTDASRVDLLFRERAFWLFLTGHRQGDLRRLVRQYGRPQSQVFPTGSYAGARGSYGTDVTLPIPAAERAYNPQFTGCINRDA